VNSQRFGDGRVSVTRYLGGVDAEPINVYDSHVAPLFPQAIAFSRWGSPGGRGAFWCGGWVMVNPWECGHDLTALRRKVNRGGAVMFGHQCLTCGRVAGKWVKRADIADPHALESWDAMLEESVLARWAETERERRASEAYSRSTRWWQVYRAFMASSYWPEMRRRVLVRAKGVCEACLVNKATQVHHTRYPHRPPAIEALEWRPPTVEDFARQPLYELRAICYPCHARQHEHMQEAAA
jgi:hypothetical protein